MTGAAAEGLRLLASLAIGAALLDAAAAACIELLAEQGGGVGAVVYLTLVGGFNLEEALEDEAGAAFFDSSI